MPAGAHRSASHYQVNIHSTATTRPSRYGAMALRKGSGAACMVRCRGTSLARLDSGPLQAVQRRIIDLVRRIVLQDLGEAGDGGRGVPSVGLHRRGRPHVDRRGDRALGRHIVAVPQPLNSVSL